MTHGRRRSGGQRRDAQGGFTLMELLVVIVILGILAAIVVFAVRGSGDKGEAAAVQTDERTIRTALELYCANWGRYPPMPDPMGELVAKKYLSNPSEYHTLTTGDGAGFEPAGLGPEGRCPNSPTNYKLRCTNTPCGAGGGQTQKPFAAVAAGESHSLRLMSDGRVFASGTNLRGQLGDGTTTPVRNVPVPVKVNGAEGDDFGGVKAVAAASSVSLALKSDGTVWSWGSNFFGQLGTGAPNTTNSLNPAHVSGLEGVVTAIAMPERGDHALALMDGKVWAWGRNTSGQLGNGTKTNSPTPVQVVGLDDVKAIDAGYDHSLALKNNGTVWAWGDNSYRQLGTTSASAIPASTIPVQVQGLGGSPVTAIASGQYHSLALKEDGTVWVWGQDVSVWGSDVDVSSAAPTEVQVGGLGSVTAISSGHSHVLASKSGAVWAWGTNGAGELGNETTTKSQTPLRVKGYGGVGLLDGVTGLSGGNNFSLAVMTNGRVLGWGSDQFGMLGTGGSDDCWVPLGPYTPVNDDFDDGREVTGPTGTATGTNREAGNEEGEPTHKPLEEESAGQSVWYRWTAPAGATRLMTFNTDGSSFNTTMGVYTAGLDGVSDLRTVTQNDDKVVTGGQSEVVFLADPQVEYHIAIDGSFEDAEGGIWLNWAPLT